MLSKTKKNELLFKTAQKTNNLISHANASAIKQERKTSKEENKENKSADNVLIRY